MIIVTYTYTHILTFIFLCSLLNFKECNLFLPPIGHEQGKTTQQFSNAGGDNTVFSNAVYVTIFAIFTMELRSII